MLHKKSFVKKTKTGNVVKVRGNLIGRPDVGVVDGEKRARVHAHTPLPPPNTPAFPSIQVVREHYLRDDIPSGLPQDPTCPPEDQRLSPTAPLYAVVDTNVALHQADVLEHPQVRDVIVCETVLREAEHRNRAAGARLRALCAASSGKRFFVFANDHHRATFVERREAGGGAAGGGGASSESANDHNDRAIRAAAAWYAKRLQELLLEEAGGDEGGAPSPPPHRPRVILVTDDAASRALALSEGVEAVGTLQFARMCADAAPDLADLVARGGGRSAAAGADSMAVDDDDDGAAAAAGGSRPSSSGGKKSAAAGGAGGPAPSSSARAAKRQRIFPEHLPADQIAAGLAAGRLYQGSLRASRFNAFEGRVSVGGVGGGGAGGKDGAASANATNVGEILISGRQDLNRAFDGDVVVVELHPESKWRRRAAPGDRNEPSDEAEEQGKAGGDKKKSGGKKDDVENDDDDDERAGDRGAFQVMGAAHFDGADAAAAEADGDDDAAAALGDEWGPGAGGARPTGRVVGILRRSWRPRGYAGSLDPRDVGLAPKTKGGLLEPVSDGRAVSALFVPVERRFPKIRIQTRQAATLADKRLVVVVDGWQADSPFPEGHYVRTLGPIGDLSTETEVLIHENDINTAPFSEAVHSCVPPLPWTVDEARDLASPHSSGQGATCSREDLRHLDVCSVDPPGCVDIDDALHCRLLPCDGGDGACYEAGVHIADVTNFVLPGTALDDEAWRRATTTYLVERRIDMLPKALTEEICSLR
jgi:exosome complex exonuclease DIS3/RRP44